MFRRSNESDERGIVPRDDSRVEGDSSIESLKLATRKGATAPPGAYIFGALRSFDLPDVVGALEGRTVGIADPVDGEDLPAEPARVRVVDSTAPIDAVHADVVVAIQKRLA